MEEERRSLRPSINQFNALFSRIVLLQALPTLFKRRPSKKLLMYGADNRSTVVEGAPEIMVANVVVERRFEGREGSVHSIEDDLLAEVGEHAFFGDGEL